jgi:hypothetical protein
MPFYRTDESGFPVLVSLDGSDEAQQQEQFDARRPVAVRGVAGFGPASNGTPGGPPPVRLASEASA